MNLKTRTTYEREYNDTSADPQICNVRDLGRQYGGQALQRHLANAEGKGATLCSHTILVFLKRLGIRHIRQREIKIQQCIYGFDKILGKIDRIPF